MTFLEAHTVNQADRSTLLKLLRPALEAGGTKRRSPERNQRERLHAAQGCLAISRRRSSWGGENLGADGLPVSPAEHRRLETVFVNLFEQVVTSPGDTLSERTLLGWQASLCGDQVPPALIGYRTSDTTFSERVGTPHTALIEEMQALLKEVWAETKRMDAELKTAWAHPSGTGGHAAMLPEIVTLSVYLQEEVCRMNPFWSHTSLVGHLAGAWVLARYSWPAAAFTDVDQYMQARAASLRDERNDPLLRLTARSLPG